MTDSILESTKKALGLSSDYTVFDADIIMHINSVFSTLQQLGVGPRNGFFIEDDSKIWSEFINDDSRLNAVKSYMYLRVRLLFDPPATSFAIDSFQKQITELEWRLNVVVEEPLLTEQETDQYDLEIIAGSTFNSIEFSYLEDDGVTPVNLTNWVPKAQIRKSAKSPLSLELTCTINNGLIAISATSQQTATLSSGQYVWALELSNTQTGIVVTLARGKVYVKPEVVR